MRAGKLETDMWNLILANVRTPVEREGDLLAQLMSLRRGEERLHFVSGPLRPSCRVSQHAAAAGLQRENDARGLRALPDGSYSL